MAVPNTSTFNLQNVQTEVDPSKDDLIDLITVANAQNGWDASYSGSKNSLLNFRNYQAGPTVRAFELSVQNSFQQSAVCSLSLAVKQTLYFDGTTTYPAVGKYVYTDSGLTNPFSGGFNYYRAGNGVNWLQIGFDGYVAISSVCS